MPIYRRLVAMADKSRLMRILLAHIRSDMKVTQTYYYKMRTEYTREIEIHNKMLPMDNESFDEKEMHRAVVDRAESMLEAARNEWIELQSLIVTLRSLIKDTEARLLNEQILRRMAEGRVVSV